MSNDTVFRTAQDAPAPKEEKAPDPKNPEKVIDQVYKTDVPVALHQEVNGLPYTAKFFNVEGIWDSPDVNYKEDIEAIEGAYRAKVESNELEDGEESFKSFIKEAEKATDSRGAPASVKIAKIAEFVRFMEKMDKIDQQRRRYAGA